MSEARFKIVFAGELMPGASLDSVKDNLARLFKSDLNKVELLFSGKPTALKRELSEGEADKYLAALRNAGALVHKQSDLAASLSLVGTDDHPDPNSLNNTESASQNPNMSCPKCGHEQAKATECAACGIVIEKFLARQALLAESAAAAPMTEPVKQTVTPPASAAESPSPYATPQAEVAEALPEFATLKVFTIEGRIGRLRYIAWSMALLLLFLVAAAVAAAGYFLTPFIGYTLGAIAVVAMAVVSVQIGVQRLHDMGWSGWLYLLTMIPYIGGIFYLLMLIVPGRSDANRYGAPPPPNSKSVKIIAATWLIVPVLGILAAIAMPQYQDYLEQATEMQQQDDSSYTVEE